MLLPTKEKQSDLLDAGAYACVRGIIGDMVSTWITSYRRLVIVILV